MNEPEDDHFTSKASRLGKFGLIGTLVSALVGASVVRDWATAEGTQAEATQGDATQGRAPVAATRVQASLASLDSFALGLLLGGFRGPLVMAMWMNIEGQKARRDYEDIDTRINLVRLLQPEFDDVHLYQIGNKAYNLSVQLTSLAAKYSAVLEGLDYAAAVERDRPLNINILARTGDIYFQKLGESTEKIYYRARIRGDSLAAAPIVQFTVSLSQRPEFEQIALSQGLEPSHYAVQQNLDPAKISFLLRLEAADRLSDQVQRLSPQVTVRPPRTVDIRDPGFRRFAHDPVLDAEGRLLAQWVTPVSGKAAMQGTTPQNTLDGSRLQFIKQFEPFPQGVSTFAFAYNAFKKADALRQVRGLRAAEFPPRVLSSRAAVALKFWAEEEFNLGRRFECAAVGMVQPLDREFPEMELQTAGLCVTAAFNPQLLGDALYNYARVSQLVAAAKVEYEAHIARFSQDRLLYRSHIAWLDALDQMLQADRLYLQAVQAAGPERDKLLAQSREIYQKTELTMLRYGLSWFVNEELASVGFPVGYSKEDASDRLPDEVLWETYTRVLSIATSPEATRNLPDLSPRELAEFATYAQRCQSRIRQIQALISSD